LAIAEAAEVAHGHGAQLINAEPPAEFTGLLRVSESERTAAGLPAVVSTMRHALGKMGVIRTARTLRVMNQKGGFDCQSCAWPDPDEGRHLAEFCENGAKAVADEAMTARVTPEFFRQWSIADLSNKSDYWLNQAGTHHAPHGAARRRNSLRTNFMERRLQTRSPTN
jgi:hypothetical protein